MDKDSPGRGDGCARLYGATLYPVESRAEARGIARGLRSVNPKWTAWQYHGRGKEPAKWVFPCAVVESSGPEGGAVWVPSSAGEWVAREEPLPLADGIAPYWYQAEAVAAVQARHGGVVEAPCGAGKTGIGTFLASEVEGRVLVLVHTLDLQRQWVARLESWLPGVSVGRIGGGKDQRDRDIVVASLSTLARWSWDELRAFGGGFGLLVADECMPAGTQIRMADGTQRPIESIRTGDMVEAWLDGEMVARPVISKSRTKTSLLFVVHAGGQTVKATGEHPFLTSRGWVPARLLKSGDMVLVERREVNDGEQEGMADSGVYDVRRASDLGQEMAAGPVEEGAAGVLWSRLLQRVQAQGVVNNDGEHQPQVRFGAHEAKQPHAPARSAGEVATQLEANRTQAAGAGWERSGADCSTTSDARSTGLRLGDGARSSDASTEGQRVPDLLQVGPRACGPESGYRGGRSVSRRTHTTSAGREEDAVSGVDGLDGSPNLQWRRVEQVRAVPIAVDVYNFGVREAESYVADGVVVHNCHHVPAESWVRVVAALPARCRVGLTATPKRKDGLHDWMHLALGPTRYRIDQRTLDESARTMPPDIRLVATGHEVVEQDHAAHTLRDVLGDEDRQEVLCRAVGQLVEDGRRVLVLTARVDHAQATAAELGGIALVGTVGASTRAAALEAVRSGACRVLVATQLADEGLDLPELDAVVLAAPSSHRPATRQRIGRACRALEGKRTPVVVDLRDDGRWATRKASARDALYRQMGWAVRWWAVAP